MIVKRYVHRRDFSRAKYSRTKEVNNSNKTPWNEHTLLSLPPILQKVSLDTSRTPKQNNRYAPKIMLRLNINPEAG